MHTQFDNNCLIDMKSYWKQDGHIIGQCLIDPSNQYFFINIPKNASSWAKNILRELDWREGDYIHEDVSNMTALVFLRDPLVRWISGITTYIQSHNWIRKDDLKENFLRLLIEKITFDSHTEKQKNFIHNLDSNAVVCFNVDSTLENTFFLWLSEKLIGIPTLTEIDKNISYDKEIYNFFVCYLNNFPEIKNKIKHYFDDDYKLIENYRKNNKFYDSN